jgi:tripartite-type tricarboxylate transporter receptor subunit TctC
MTVLGNRPTWRISVLALSLVLATGGADAAEPSLNGKLVTIISGSAAGGTVDAMARSFAQFVPKYVPGAPRAIVQNVPGAGQLRGAQTAARSKPDGLTLGIFSPRWMTNYLLGEPVSAIDFDAIKFVGTYRTERRVYMACLRREVATSWDELKKSGKKMVTGVPEFGGTWDAVWRWLEGQNYPVKVIAGYTGEAETNFAINRNELNASAKCQDENTAFPAQYPQWQKNFWAPIFYFGNRELDQQALDVVKKMGFAPPPYLWDIIPSPGEDLRMAFEVQDVAGTYSSAIFLPAGTSDDMHKMWLKAFDDIAKDKDFIAAATKSMGMVPVASSGVTIRKAFTDFIQKLDGLGIREDVRKRYKEINR